MDLDQVDRVGRRQHGLVTTAQLRDAGFSRHQIRQRVDVGILVPYRRGVFRLAGTAVTRDQAWTGAVLAAAPGHVLSHASAAFAWQLRGFEQPAAIDLLTEGARASVEGVVAHRTKHLPPDHRTVLRGIPISTVARTLVDACGLVSVAQVGRAVDDALRRQILTLNALVRCAAGVPWSGRRRIRPIRAVLAERVPGYEPGGSAAELEVMAILRRAGLPLPVQQHRVVVEGRTYRLDYAWPETMHCLEYQGSAWHASVSALHDDSDRTRRLQRGGWRVWPLTDRTSEAEIVAIAELATADTDAARGAA